MEKIKNLYDGINYVTFPKIIIDELRKLSTERSSISTRVEDAKMTKVYGDFINPMFMYFSQDNFYLNIDYYYDLIKKVELGVCFDENDNKIDGKNIFYFFEEYGKGFVKGYNDFESTLKSSNSLFNTSDEQISFKVYSRIKEHWTENKNGTIILNAGKIKNDNVTFLFTEENFFKSGFNGGEFYKAWEIILNNPTIFEPIFKKNNDLKVEKNSNEENIYNSIIINLHLQLSFIIRRIKDDLKRNCYVENYLICEKNAIFLDYLNLIEYVTKQDIKNTGSLLIICDYCKQIVNLWNNDLINVLSKGLEEPFIYNSEEDNKFFSSPEDFNCVLLNNKEKEIWFNTTVGKEHFFKDYDYSIFTLPQIANKCVQIFNYLYLSFDEVKNKFEQSESKAEVIENQNPYPLVFTSYKVYVCFVEYKKHIIDFYTDYSYLKKRLEKLKLIHYHTDNNFMKFLLNEINFISQSEFDEYSIKYESKLKSLSKSFSVSRYNNFDIVFNEFV